MNVMHAYAATKMPAQQATTMNTVGLVFERYTRRPAKKRNRERCRREGNASTTAGTRKSSTPLEKNARMRARLCGLYCGGWVILMYRRAHCCSSVARAAHVRLMVKLRNHSELTQMAYFCGEKVDRSARVDSGEVDTRDA